MTGTATRTSPFMDMLRHRYESGATISDLAYWFSTNRRQMAAWLELAGATIKRRKGRK